MASASIASSGAGIDPSEPPPTTVITEEITPTSDAPSEVPATGTTITPSMSFDWVGGAPQIPGCTLDPDYTLDPSACWALPPISPTPTSREGAAQATPTNFELVLGGDQCETGRIETKTTNGVTASFCTTTVGKLNVGHYSWIATTSLIDDDASPAYMKISVPPSRETCLPGPKSCLYRYYGTQCPNGHVALSQAVERNTATFYCCPQADNLAPTLEQRTESETLYVDASSTKIFSDGPGVLCSYTGGAIQNNLFPTSYLTLISASPISSMNDLLLHPLLIKNTAYTNQPPTSSTPAPPAPPSPPGKTLSTPSKIGIIIGASLAALILLASIALLLLRRARKKKMTNRDTHEKPELDGQPRYKVDYAAEITAGERYEMPAPVYPVEADFAKNVVEVEAKHGVNEVRGDKYKER